MADFLAFIFLGLGTLGLGFWLGDLNGARRASAEARDALAESEAERGQLVEALERLKVLYISANRSRRHRMERIQRVRALTLTTLGDALPNDTPLTVGQVCDALDRTPHTHTTEASDA